MRKEIYQQNSSGKRSIQVTKSPSHAIEAWAKPIRPPTFHPFSQVLIREFAQRRFKCTTPRDWFPKRHKLTSYDVNCTFLARMIWSTKAKYHSLILHHVRRFREERRWVVVFSLPDSVSSCIICAKSAKFKHTKNWGQYPFGRASQALRKLFRIDCCLNVNVSDWVLRKFHANLVIVSVGHFSRRFSGFSGFSGFGFSNTTAPRPTCKQSVTRQC